MSKSLCSVEGCGGVSFCRTWCRNHYMVWWRKQNIHGWARFLASSERVASFWAAANNLTTVREAIRVGIARVDALRSLLASYRNVG